MSNPGVDPWGVADDDSQPDAFTEDHAHEAIDRLAPGSTITSQYRTPQHNAEVGGVPNSQHMSASAADVVLPKGMTAAKFRDRLEDQGYPVTEFKDEGSHVHWAWGTKGVGGAAVDPWGVVGDNKAANDPWGVVPAIPEQGEMSGKLHLDAKLAPKVPDGAPRPFAPGEYIENEDGTWSSELTLTVKDKRLNHGRPTNIPSLWIVDGKPTRVDQDQAIDFAAQSKLPFESYHDLKTAEGASNTREGIWQKFNNPKDARTVPSLWSAGENLQAFMDINRAMGPEKASNFDEWAPQAQPDWSPEIEEQPSNFWGGIGKRMAGGVERTGAAWRKYVAGAMQAVAEHPGAYQGEAEGFVEAGSHMAGPEMSKADQARRAEMAQRAKVMFDKAAAEVKAQEPGIDAPTSEKLAYQLTAGTIDILPLLAATILTGSPLVGGTLMAAQGVASKYGEARAAGRNADQAAYDAAFTGVTSGVLGSLQIGLVMKPGQTFLAKTLQGAGSFGIISVLTEAMQVGYDMGLVDPKMTLKEAGQRVLDAGIVGILQGALLGGGHAAMESAVGRLEAQVRQKASDQAAERARTDAYIRARARQYAGQPEPPGPPGPPGAPPGGAAPAPQPVPPAPAPAPAAPAAGVPEGFGERFPAAAQQVAREMGPVEASVRQALGMAPKAKPAAAEPPAPPPEPPVQRPHPDVLEPNGAGIPRRTLDADVAVTSTGREVPVHYAIVDAAHLIPSQTDEGNPNPAFPQELQPRDRSRAISQTQIASIAQNINPRLLDRSPNASDGAPIVAPSGVVESGNGRTLALRRAYAENLPSAQAYRQYLAEQGYPVEGMEAPVLVRVRTADMAPSDRQAFVREANQSGQLGFSATERAMSDAAAMPDHTLELYRGGDVESAANREFVRSVMAHAINPNEHAGMVSAQGELSQQAIARIRAALLAKAYGDPELVARIVESQDNNVKAIGGALTDAAADWAKMRAAVTKGDIPAELDQTGNLLAAVKLVSRARAEGRNVAEFVNQNDIFSGQSLDPDVEAWLRMMFRNTNQWTVPVGRDKLADALRYYAGEAQKVPNGNNLLGEPPVTGRQILETARARQYGGESQGPGAPLNFGEDPGAYGAAGAGARAAGAEDEGSARLAAAGAVGFQQDNELGPTSYGFRPARATTRGTEQALSTDLSEFLKKAGADPASPGSTLGGVANYILARGRETRSEGLGYRKPDGTTGAHTFNQLTEVRFGSMEADLAKPGAGVVTIHNHPSSRGPSGGDIASLGYPGHDVMAVVGHNGDWHMHRLAAATKGSHTVVGRALLSLVNEINAVVQRHINIPFHRGRISTDDAMALHTRIVSQTLDRAGITDYLTNTVLDDARVQPVIDAALKEATNVAISRAKASGVIEPSAQNNRVHRPAGPLRFGDGITLLSRGIAAGRGGPSSEVGPGAGQEGPSPYRKPFQPRLLEDERRYTESPAFKSWFGESKIVDDAGKPERMYRGDWRDVGPKFKKAATTSSRFYFTNDPKVASNYAEGKHYVDEAKSDYEHWFTFNPPKGGRRRIGLAEQWHYLSDEQKERVKDTLLRARKNEDGEVEFSDKQDGGIAGKQNWGYWVAEARGNWLQAGIESWLMGGVVHGEEQEFSKVLNHAGLKHEFDNPHESRPVVTPVYLSVKNPVSTRAITPEFINRIANEVRYTRERPASWANNWDKAGVTSKEWVENLRADHTAKGGGTADLTDSYVWTSMPENVTKALQRMGYDGVDDRGGKAAGPAGVLSPGQDNHRVVVAFEPEQIKSAIGNRGTFDPNNPNILREDENRYEANRPPFYSALTRSIEDTKMSRAPAKDWLGLIQNLIAKGVKEEEIAWSGVRDWLQDQKGPVSKADLLEHLRSNEVQVQEVVKSGNSSDPDNFNSPKFAPYALPGGKNYRELLLTTPLHGSAWNHLQDRIHAKIEALADEGINLNDLPKDDPRNIEIRAMQRQSDRMPAQQPFKSGHWDEPNVLAHVRFDDRAGPGGEKVLHVAEVQSDWHQKGRREGYKEEVSPNPPGWATTGPATDRGRGVPNAPFKTSWHELAAKRMLRYAAEHGYDRLSFDTGDTNAERYDLSKQIRELRVHRSDSNYALNAIGNDGHPITFPKTFSAQELPDAIGKDMAEKIVRDYEGAPSGRVNTYKGLDLKVGGEGMRGFYDKILPTFLNKYAKKWGAKVEQASIPANQSTLLYEGPTPTKKQIQAVSDAIHARPTDKRFISPVTGKRLEYQINRVSNESAFRDVVKEMERGKSFADAMESHGSHDLAYIFGGDMVQGETPGGASAHSVKITPEMRKSVMEGQALFEDKQRYSTEPGALDASGKPVEQTIMPGAEPSAVQLAKAREAAAGGKMKTKAEQKPPGGLFGAQGVPGDDQLSLFEDPRRYNEIDADDRQVLEKAARTGNWIGKFKATGANGEARIRDAIAKAFAKWRRQPMSVPMSARRAFGNLATFTDVPTTRPTATFAQRLRKTVDSIFALGHETQMLVVPMARGSNIVRAVAKDFANGMRLARWHGNRMMQELKKNFSHDRLAYMWQQADEESVLRQQGQPTAGRGLSLLTPEERAVVMGLQDDAQNVWQAAKDQGMVEGEGLPSYVPRMMVEMAGDKVQRLGSGEEARSIPGMGRNLRTTTPQMKHRKHLTTTETEQAGSQKFDTMAHVVRDIRTLPLATMRMREAVAGRALINKIKEIGRATGEDTVVEGHEPAGSPFKWFTISNPAFQTWRPKFLKNEESGKYEPVKDQNGDMVFEKVPIYVREDFEGPLRAVLTGDNSKVYNALMDLKGRSMSSIMFSPLVQLHLLTELGRSLPTFPLKIISTKLFFEGNAAKKDPGVMSEAIMHGLVPIGHDFQSQDISGMEQPDSIKPGRSWTSDVLSFIPNLFDPRAGDAVKRGVDRMGDLLHNVLLWDRVADLQMGLYQNFKTYLVKKGMDTSTAQYMAAHFANRYAGTLPAESMSNMARKTANLLLFSRTYTLGNLAVVKDIGTGLPRDVQAQIERDSGALMRDKAVSLSRRKTAAVIAIDVALAYAGYSLLQNAFDIWHKRKDLNEIEQGYVDRLVKLGKVGASNPFAVLNPFADLDAISATAENEPDPATGKPLLRVLVGTDKQGTAIYARNPTGKFAEEYRNWVEAPGETLKSKLSPYVKPLWDIMANDKGFGRHIYNQSDPLWKAAAKMGQHYMEAFVPLDQLQAGRDLLMGKTKELDAERMGLRALGVTMRRGAPGGPAVGEMYQIKKEHDAKVQEAMPDIIQKIKDGDLAGARKDMHDLGIPPGLQNYYVRVTKNPKLRLNTRTNRQLLRSATPEQRERVQQLRGAQ